MKLLSIGTDRKLFDESSSVFLRTMSYATRMEEMHMIVFSLSELQLPNKKIGNLHLYPTNSASKSRYISDAVRIGKQIMRNSIKSPDTVISAQDPFETGLVAYRLKRKFKLPLQIQMHTDIFSSHFQNSLLNSIRVILAKFLIPRADGLRVVSFEMAKYIGRKYPKMAGKTEVLPVFVNVDGIESVVSGNGQLPSSYKFEKTVLMSSRLAKEKRYDVALKAMKEVVEKFPDAGLVICGTGSEKEYIEKMEKKLGLIGKIKLRGWESIDTLALFYKLSDVFLLTSEYEGYGMTLVEAGLAGCPIVTTRVGLAKSEIFKDGINSYVCPVGDVRCLSEKIIDLLSNRERQETFRRNMREEAKKISMPLSDYTNKYVSILENLLKR